MAADVLPPPANEAARVSRYRSARKVQQQHQRTQSEEVPPLPTSRTAKTAISSQQTMEVAGERPTAVGRSASRYHRRPPAPLVGARQQQPNPPPSRHPVPALPGSVPQSTRAHPSATLSESAPGPEPESPRRFPPRTTFTRKAEKETKRADAPSAFEDDSQQREEARKLARVQAERQRLMVERETQEQAEAYEQLMKERAAKEVEEGKGKEKIRRRYEQEELQAKARSRQEVPQRIAETNTAQIEEKRRPADIKVPAVKADSPVSSPPSATKWGFFKRRKADDSPKSPMTTPPSTSDSRPKTSHGTTSSRSQPTSSPPRARKSAESPSATEAPTIKPGGGGIVPGIDAPISAVNANERRVMVECGRTVLPFPVTPETTPLNLIRSASNCMAEDFDPRAAIILEVYSKANVQRPLRMYEHVRDVMNSWDSDNQHTLVIIPSTPDGNNELYASFAPKKQPEGAHWTMYYSNKPGKWDKKLITLKPEGELCHDKSNGKEMVRICHLSDFEIYSIMPKRLKKVNPKKKFCLAIKSQQKSNMFMDMSTYIHLFACGDQQTADNFYRTIQEWRSWYLVDVMGEGETSRGEQKKKEPTTIPNYLRSSLNEQVNQSRSAPHLRSGSVESHYVLGTFNSLDIDIDKMMAKEEEKPLAAEQKLLPLVIPSAVEHTRVMHEQKLAERKPTAPPISFPKSMNTRSSDESGSGRLHSSGGHGQQKRDRDGHYRAPTGDGTFASNGLLGREYAERQRNIQMQTRATDGHHEQQPSSCLRRTGSTRSQRSVASRRHSIDGSRTNSLRSPPPHMMPKPLVDLTPQFKEAPQFQKKGRGYRPDHVCPGGLIDAVQSPDDPMGINAPPSRDWRRPQTSAGSLDRDRTRYHSRDVQRAPSSPQGYPPPVYSGALTNGHERTKSLKGHGVKMEVSALTDGSAFTGAGLLGRMNANQKKGWGAGDRGHGYARGSDAKSPMMDMREPSKFQKGSLLGSMES